MSSNRRRAKLLHCKEGTKITKIQLKLKELNEAMNDKLNVYYFLNFASKFLYCFVISADLDLPFPDYSSA